MVINCLYLMFSHRDSTLTSAEGRQFSFVSPLVMGIMFDSHFYWSARHGLYFKCLLTLITGLQHSLGQGDKKLAQRGQAGQSGCL